MEVEAMWYAQPDIWVAELQPLYYFSWGSKTGTHWCFKQNKNCVYIKKTGVNNLFTICNVSCSEKLWCHIYLNIRWKFFPKLSEKCGDYLVFSCTQNEICVVWLFSWRFKIVNGAVICSDKYGIVIQIQHCFVICVVVTSV